jgi:transcriptional regulator with XRE-family HTH domain
MTVQNGRAFNEWLRTQLKAKKMSQRQLAQQSGVDHSTISPHYFGIVASSTSHPTARVEYALRSDDLLSEPQVRQVMEYYLALRMRRLAAARQSTGVGANGADPRAAMVGRMPNRN